jgi:adenylate cyclase
VLYVIVRKLDSIRVKGKLKSVKVYELLATKEEGLSERMQKIIGYYNQGIEAYRNKQCNDAIIAFKSALSIDGKKDTPSKNYLVLCEELKLNPPGTDWEDVYVMRTK